MELLLFTQTSIILLFILNIAKSSQHISIHEKNLKITFSKLKNSEVWKPKTQTLCDSGRGSDVRDNRLCLGFALINTDCLTWQEAEGGQYSFMPCPLLLLHPPCAELQKKEVTAEQTLEIRDLQRWLEVKWGCEAKRGTSSCVYQNEHLVSSWKYSRADKL